MPRMLIPDMLAAGLLGYYYTCPDMIDKAVQCFLNVKEFDEELIVRSCRTCVNAYDAIFCSSLEDFK